MVTEITIKSHPVNLKEQNAQFTFALQVRDRDHFYKVVNWLNSNVGKGEDNWTMAGRVLKSLKQGKSVSTKVYIFKADFDQSASLYLSLL